MMKLISLRQNQIQSLFSQAYTANAAIIFAGIIVCGAFIYAQQTKYLFTFGLILLFATACRIILTFYAKKSDNNKLNIYVNYYTLASLILGLDFSFITLAFYDLQNYELRTFLTIVNLGLITASIATSSVWIRAYLSFSIPQLLALIAVYILRENYFVAISAGVFSWFMVATAKNFNAKFKEAQLLLEQNNKLISNMESEIQTRKNVQGELEEYQCKLKETVKERTSELEKINADLNEEINKRCAIEKELEFLAYYDELTQLPNRTLFIENLKNSLVHAKRNDSLLGVLFVDLDRFKNINDSHGHYIGDSLLKTVSERLKNVLRDSDTIARNGGDEFVIYIENMKDAREPFVVAQKIIEVMNNRFDIDGHTIHIGASIGISLYPLDGDEALELLKMADTAMYEAKNIGRNNFQFYSSAMSNQISDRLKLENSLRSALENNEFHLVYQPQVNAVTQKTTGFEALIRWENNEFGKVSPINFIPILEETGLIYSVGEWVILEVLEFIKSGKSNNTKVSINLSALQCGIDNYSSKLKNFIDASGVDPALIEFEITETLLISDFSQTEMFLTDVSNLGCTIALDDFGTGYTSFSYLTKLPIDIIKIDRSLVSGINTNKNLQDIVRAIVTMCESLGIENVFEGVENEEELNMVKQLHGSVIQGYYFSKPLDINDIANWFSDKIDTHTNKIIKLKANETART